MSAAIDYFRKELTRLLEFREYFHKRGDSCPNIDKKIGLTSAALAALEEKAERELAKGIEPSYMKIVRNLRASNDEEVVKRHG